MIATAVFVGMSIKVHSKNIVPLSPLTVMRILYAGVSAIQLFAGWNGVDLSQWARIWRVPAMVAPGPAVSVAFEAKMLVIRSMSFFERAS